MATLKKTWWLFLLPFLVPLSLWLVQGTQKPKVVQGSPGNVLSDLEGERLTLRSLSYRLVHEPFDVASIDWIILSPAKGKPFLSRAVIEYDRRNHRLTEWIITRVEKHPNGGTQLSYHYENVTEDAIHQVASSQGVAKDLLKYGAVLKEKKRE